MNVTATKRIALATLTAPVLAALAIGLASTASAETPASGTAQDVVSQFQADGHPVVVTKAGSAPLEKCTVIATRQDQHDHHGGPDGARFNTVYVDAFCPDVA